MNKKLLFLIVLKFSTTDIIGQFVNKNCSNLKTDTTIAFFIYELNSAGKYYSSENQVLQKNLFYFDQNYNSKDIGRIYLSDSIVIVKDDNNSMSRDYKECLNLPALSRLMALTEWWQLKRKQKKHFKRSIFTDKYGNKYLRLKIKVIYINSGSQTVLYPIDYCKEKFELNNYCIRNVPNTFVLIDVLEVSYFQ